MPDFLLVFLHQAIRQSYDSIPEFVRHPLVQGNHALMQGCSWASMGQSKEYPGPAQAKIRP